MRIFRETRWIEEVSLGLRWGQLTRFSIDFKHDLGSVVYIGIFDDQLYFHSNFSQDGTFLSHWDGTSLPPFVDGLEDFSLTGAGGEFFVGETLMGVDPHARDDVEIECQQRLARAISRQTLEFDWPHRGLCRGRLSSGGQA